MREKNSIKQTTLGEMITKARRSKGWTKKKLAQKLNLSAAYLGQIEEGRIPPLKTLDKIGIVLKINVFELVVKPMLTKTDPKTQSSPYFTFLEELSKFAFELRYS